MCGCLIIQQITTQKIKTRPESTDLDWRHEAKNQLIVYCFLTELSRSRITKNKEKKIKQF